HRLRDARGRGHRAAAAARARARTQEAPMTRRPVNAPRQPKRYAARLPRLTLALALALAPALSFARAAPAHAQEQTGRGVQRTPEGVTLDFQDADLRVVIATLAQVAGLDVVLSNLPARTVTLRTSGPVSAEQVRRYLESVVRAQGLEMIEEGGLVRIAGGDSAQAPAMVRQAVTSQRAAQQARVQLYVHPLRHARAEP